MENYSDISFDNGNEIIRYKIVMIGDISVGKTSFMTRIVENRFKDNYEPSVGIDFSSKILKYKGKQIKLQIWDSAGQEKYKGLIPSYIRGSALVFIVYDVSRRETFMNLTNWISFAKNIESCLLVIIGNKIDLEKTITTVEGEELARKEGALFFEVSSKTNQNLFEALFESISYFPYFNQFKMHQKKIAHELKIENCDGLDNDSPSNAQSDNKIQVKDGKYSKGDGSKKCLC